MVLMNQNRLCTANFTRGVMGGLNWSQSMLCLQTLYLEDGTVVPDASCTSRPPRPNSIEVKRSYPAGYSSEEIYAAQRNAARSPQDNTYRSVHLFHYRPISYSISVFIYSFFFILVSVPSNLVYLFIYFFTLFQSGEQNRLKVT